MNVFERLAQAVHQQNTEGELPDFVVPLLRQVIEHPEDFAGREDLVGKLTERVLLYETYSEMCCEKIGFGLEDIHRTLDELKVRY